MTGNYRYDFFISYAEADRGWVEGYLLAALTRVEVRYIHESEFSLGTPKLLEIERAIKQSKYTILVITPKYLTDQFSELTTVMGQTYGTKSRTWPVISLILKPVALPLHLEVAKLSATNQQEQKAAITRLCDQLTKPVPFPEPPPDCPYPGMRPFQQANAEQFYGRRDEVGQLLNRVKYESFTFVVGASGSGKSSLVLAGLIPELKKRQDNLWFVQVARPSNQPDQSLKNQIQQLKHDLEAQPATTNSNALIAIDQFEEFFNQVDKTKQEHFIQNFLKDLPQQTCKRLRIQHCNLLIILRADFFGDLMNCSLWEKAKDARFEITPLKATALREAIVEPAKAKGVYFDERLIDRLINNAGNESGALPLLQETLILLWQRMEWRWISLDAYEQLSEGNQSGLSLVLAKKADEIYKNLSNSQQRIAQRIFLRLIQFGEGRPDTRRQLSCELLISRDDSRNEFYTTIHCLTENRLLTLDDPTQSGNAKVDISHEALLYNWSELQKWLVAYRSAEQSRRRLEDRVKTWSQLGQKGGFLDEVELRDAKNWINSPYVKILGLQQSILDFVKVSEDRILKARDEKESLQQEKLESERRRAEEQTKAAKKLRQRLRVAIIAIVLAFCMAIAAFLGFQNADQQRQVALTRQLAAQAEVLRTQNINALQRGLLLALESMRRSPSAEAEETIRGGLDLLPTALTRISFPNPLKLVTFSPTGESIAVVDTGNVIYLFQTQTGQKIVSQKFTEDIKKIVFNPTKDVLAVATNKNAYLLAEENLQLLTQFSQKAIMPLLAFSSDGSLLAINTEVWNIATSQKILDSQIIVRGEGKEGRLDDREVMSSIAFSSNNELIALGFYGARMLISTRTGQIIEDLRFSYYIRDLIDTLAFSPDNKYVAVGTGIGTFGRFGVQLYKVKTAGNIPNRIEPIRLLEHRLSVSSVAFSSKSRYLATVSFDGTSHIVDLSTQREVMHLKHGCTKSVAFSSDEKYLITWDDRSLRVWDIKNWREVMRITDFSGIQPKDTSYIESDYDYIEHKQRVAVDFQGKYIATVSNQHELAIWTLTPQNYVAHLESGNSTHAIAFSPNSKYLATTSGLSKAYNNIALLWNIETKKQVAAFNTEDILELGYLSFSKNSKYLFLHDHILNTSNFKDAFPVRKNSDRHIYVNLSPDDRYVAFSKETGDTSIREIASEREILRIKQGNSFTFSPNGTYLATTTSDTATKIRTTTVWLLPAGQTISHFQYVHEGSDKPVEIYKFDVVFSPDERLILTTSPDSWRLWEVASGRQIQQIQVNRQVGKLSPQDRSSSSVLDPFSPDGFSPDGRYLVRRGKSNLWVWDTASGRLAMQLELSEAESVAFSPNGAFLAISSQSKPTRLWNTHSWKEVDLLSRDNLTNAIAFSADGKFLAVTNNEGTQVWNTGTLQQEASLAESAHGIAFSPDSQYLAIAMEDSVLLWPWRPDKLLSEACSRLTRNLTQDEWKQYLGIEPYHKTCPNLP